MIRKNSFNPIDDHAILRDPEEKAEKIQEFKEPFADTKEYYSCQELAGIFGMVQNTFDKFMRSQGVARVGLQGRKITRIHRSQIEKITVLIGLRELKHNELVKLAYDQQKQIEKLTLKNEGLKSEPNYEFLNPKA